MGACYEHTSAVVCSGCWFECNIRPAVFEKCFIAVPVFRNDCVISIGNCTNDMYSTSDISTFAQNCTIRVFSECNLNEFSFIT